MRIRLSESCKDAGAFAEKEKRIGELEAEIAQLKRQLMDTKLQVFCCCCCCVARTTDFSLSISVPSLYSSIFFVPISLKAATMTRELNETKKSLDSLRKVRWIGDVLTTTLTNP
jgi:ribosomal protein L29